MAEWKLHTLHAQSYGTGPDRAPWLALFCRTEEGEEQEIGLLYSELKAEVERLEADGHPVPLDFREALKMMENAKEFRPLA
jgi:hypothetical protein